MKGGASSMSLPAEIMEVPDRLSRIALDLRASVQAIRGERPAEAVMHETAQLVLIIGAIGAESARLRGLCGAARATGGMERTAGQPVPGADFRLLASLHRAGDHTMDPEEGEAL